MKVPIQSRHLALCKALLCYAVSAASASDFPSLIADRAAIERVYYAHRTGTKPAFEEAMPPALVERLVRADWKKEIALKKNYGVEITDALVEAEVGRINTTTRAPEILGEIKAALGNDVARFARSMARPIVVERELRPRFENDDALHEPQRRVSEEAREAARAAVKDGLEAQIGVLRASKGSSVNEVTWQLTGRPDAEKPETVAPSPQTKGVAKSGAYSIEATAQIAQALTPPADERDRKFYFEELDPELQKVLRAQLQIPGDVSALIETPSAFLLFIAREKTATALNACSLSIPKRSYEDWLAQQPDESP